MTFERFDGWIGCLRYVLVDAGWIQQVRVPWDRDKNGGERDVALCSSEHIVSFYTDSRRLLTYLVSFPVTEASQERD